MAKQFFISNWKAQKTLVESEQWIDALSILSHQLSVEKEIIIAPPYTLLSSLSWLIADSNLPFKVASQDLSAFPRGAYTGEVPSELLKEFVSYTLIGHSERREYQKESDELLSEKVKRAIEVGITPIFCVSNSETIIPQGVSIVAYEPTSAISTSGIGTPDTPENAEAVARVIKERYACEYVLYGGSVTPENVKGYTSQPSLSGVLVGKASLDPQVFITVITNA